MAPDIMPWVWSTAVVVLLLLALLWVLRGWPTTMMRKTGRSAPALKLVSSLNLGPQQRIVTVSWQHGQGGTVYLLGVTPHQITCLQTLPASSFSDGARVEADVVSTGKRS